MNDILARTIRHNPPSSQRGYCKLTVRQSIATLGPVHDDDGIRGAAIGLAVGLFGDAFDNADQAQQTVWIDMMEAEYRLALQPSA